MRFFLSALLVAALVFFFRVFAGPLFPFFLLVLFKRRFTLVTSFVAPLPHPLTLPSAGVLWWIDAGCAL